MRRVSGGSVNNTYRFFSPPGMNMRYRKHLLEFTYWICRQVHWPANPSSFVLSATRLQNKRTREDSECSEIRRQLRAAMERFAAAVRGVASNGDLENLSPSVGLAAMRASLLEFSQRHRLALPCHPHCCQSPLLSNELQVDRVWGETRESVRKFRATAVCSTTPFVWEELAVNSVTGIPPALS